MILTTLGIAVAPENMEKAMGVMLPMLGPTRAESGCIACDLYQSADDEMRLILIEQWESLAHLERHIRLDNFRRVLAWIEMSVEPPEIRFDTVSTSRGLDIIETVRNRS